LTPKTGRGQLPQKPPVFGSKLSFENFDWVKVPKVHVLWGKLKFGVSAPQVTRGPRGAAPWEGGSRFQEKKFQKFMKPKHGPLRTPLGDSKKVPYPTPQTSPGAVGGGLWKGVEKSSKITPSKITNFDGVNANPNSFWVKKFNPVCPDLPGPPRGPPGGPQGGKLTN